MIAHGFRGRTGPFAAAQQRKARQGVQVPYASRTASLTEEMGMQSVESSVSRFPVFSRYYCSFFFHGLLLASRTVRDGCV